MLPEFKPAEYSVIVPLGVILPIALVVPRSVNQTLPSGPCAIVPGALSGHGLRPSENFVVVPLAGLSG